jgi:hypothetical protein
MGRGTVRREMGERKGIQNGRECGILGTSACSRDVTRLHE